MRIACPACNAAYQVPDAQLREGRLVRCARCGTDWAPIAPIPPPEPETVVEPEPIVESPPEPPHPPRAMVLDDEVPMPPLAPVPPPPVAPVAPKPRRAPLLAIAWVLSVAIVIGGLTYLVVARDRVMAMWPPSIRGYAALGLAARPPASGDTRPHG